MSQRVRERHHQHRKAMIEDHQRALAEMFPVIAEPVPEDMVALLGKLQ